MNKISYKNTSLSIVVKATIDSIWFENRKFLFEIHYLSLNYSYNFVNYPYKLNIALWQNIL